MERQLLTVFFIVISVVGCQQTPTTIKGIPNEISKNTSYDLVEKKDSYENIWEYLQVNNKIKQSNYLDEQILSYMNNHLRDIDKFEEYLNDSYYFLYFVIKELEKNNLPIELSILPYIESNYDPFSISPSGAVGMWQFMPRTGRLYELNKSWWSEDRHDPFKSTEAAIGYLKYLYQRFDGDIYLSIAAYNAGPSLVDKRINQNKKKGEDINFWSLNKNTLLLVFLSSLFLIIFSFMTNYGNRVSKNKFISFYYNV